MSDGGVPLKKIGFLSFGHWTDSHGSQVRSAADSLLQSIELAVAAEELGADGAYFRVHHFARQLSSPFPLLAAVGARTRRSRSARRSSTCAMRTRLHGRGRRRGGPHRRRTAAAGNQPRLAGAGDRRLAALWLRARGWRERCGHGTPSCGGVPRPAQGDGFAKPNPRPMFPNPPGLLRIEPHSDGLRDRIWWGSSSNATSRWAAKLGMNLQSSTLKDDESGEPLHVQQRKQIEAYREAWKEAGHRRDPRVSVSRSIFALVDDRDRAYFGRDARDRDQIGYIDANTRAIFGRSYAAEPDVL